MLIDMSLDAEEPGAFWRRWPTLPAVQSGRVLRVDPELLTMPGPALDRSLLVLARALYGEALLKQIEAALGDGVEAAP